MNSQERASVGDKEALSRGYPDYVFRITWKTKEKIMTADVSVRVVSLYAKRHGGQHWAVSPASSDLDVYAQLSELRARPSHHRAQGSQ